MALYEAEVLPGLESFARSELEALAKDRMRLVNAREPGSVWFEYAGSIQDLIALRRTVAVYRIEHFDVPRPRALLGHAHLKRITGRIDHIRGNFPSGTFTTFRISAAGSDSSVFARIIDELAGYTRLVHSPDEGDLFLRVRKAKLHRSGWEMLFRITPRPLATRAWRTCDMPGALNATIAAAIIDLTKPCADDLFLNPMCGSGSLMIERAAWGGAQAIGGCDINPDALECAAQNIAKANFSEQVEIFAMDATQLDLPDATFDVICADLPWGQLTGTHEENAQLYPLALTEWGRVAKSGARMVLITHEIALFEPLVTSIKDTWELRHSLKVFQGGLHPRIYVFRRM